VIIKPRITEKAVGKSEQNVYTFVVARTATKYDVADAVRALYNVTPVKVNIVNKSPRRTMSRSKGRMVTEKGLKKAYVYLKAGDTITLV
jgi:large subunit ribosomal protein L23